MKKPEQAQWEALRRATDHRILFQRHEDKYSPDIPDLSFATPMGSGWIELKTLDDWPARAATPVNIPHLRPGQVVWAQARWMIGVNCWMLLRIVKTNEWLLLDPYTMSKILHRECDRGSVQSKARAYWVSTPDPTTFEIAITSRVGERTVESVLMIDKSPFVKLE